MSSSRDDQKENAKKLVKFNLFRHVCGGVMRIGLLPTDDGNNTETYAVCDNCKLGILIHTGEWEDERFQAAMATHTSGNPQA